MNPLAASLAALLFKRAFPLYFALYSAYKKLTGRELQATLDSLVEPGMTVVDIGANVGYFTRRLAGRVGGNGRVYAFEPDPENFARLKRRLSHCPNTVLSNAAASDVTGRGQLHVSPDLNVDHRIYDAGAGRDVLSIQVTTLDDAIPENLKVDVIKIDVQGAEWRVLAGAQAVLAKNPHVVIVMEFWPHGIAASGHDPARMLDDIENLGFSIQTLGTPFERSELAGLAGRKDWYTDLVLRRNAVPAAAEC